MPLSNLVGDWGGFEKLVAKLHETGTVTVQHNVKLLGKGGTKRQIDVLVSHRVGLYNYRTVIECKHWRRRVSRLHVDALVNSVSDIGASNGVIFSAVGFQSGAIETAKQYGIDLFLVREVQEYEWGRPGKVIDVFVQTIQPTIGNLTFPGLIAVVPGPPSDVPTPIRLDLVIGVNGTGTQTPTLKLDRSPGDSLERIILTVAQEEMKALTLSHFVLDGGTDCTRYFIAPIIRDITEPVSVRRSNGTLIISKTMFTLGIAVIQKRLVIDRSASHAFILAVHSYIDNRTQVASRKVGDSITTFGPTASDTPNAGEYVANGSALKAYVDGLFPFADLVNNSPILLSGPLGQPHSQTGH